MARWLTPISFKAACSNTIASAWTRRSWIGLSRNELAFTQDYPKRHRWRTSAGTALSHRFGWSQTAWRPLAIPP